MGVTAEHPVGLLATGVQNRPGSDFMGKAKPAGVQPVRKPRKVLAFEIQLLEIEVQQGTYAAEHKVFGDKTVELVSVNGQMALAIKLPGIFLIYPHTHQVRHYGAQSAVVIALNPDDFNLALGIGKLTYETEKFPMLFGQATEIEIGKDITEQDQASKGRLREQRPRIVSAA